MLVFFSVFFLLCSQESTAQYQTWDTKGCATPFNYMGKSYSNCTDRDRSFPWCSLTSSFKGVWKYCYDMTKTNWECSTECYTDADYPYCYTQNHDIRYCVEKVLDLNKRVDGSCSDDFKSISPYHTACLPPSPFVAKKGVSNQEKSIIVDMHNEWRRNVAVPAAGMFKLRWDDNLAYVAQKHADQCSFYHDDMTLRVIPNTGKYPGQNIAISGGLTSMNWSTAFDTMFAGEMKRWQYGLGIKKEFGNKHALHYIQIILDRLTHVGCGYADCLFYHTRQQTFVCLYDSLQTAGDLKEPYKKGSFCSDCPNSCENKLCDCKGIQCLNSGVLDPKTCTCKCQGFWSGVDCSTPVVPKVDDTTGCYWPFLFEDKLNYECVSIDEMKICSKSPELDENADYHVCDDSSGSNRDKRSIDKSVGIKISSKRKRDVSVDLLDEENMINKEDRVSTEIKAAKSTVATSKKAKKKKTKVSKGPTTAKI